MGKDQKQGRCRCDKLKMTQLFAIRRLVLCNGTCGCFERPQNMLPFTHREMSGEASNFSLYRSDSSAHNFLRLYRSRKLNLEFLARTKRVLFRDEPSCIFAINSGPIDCEADEFS